MSLTPFVTLSGPAAAMPDENIDTDIIFPARFLLLTAREGLGLYAFHDRRFAADGSEITGFVLNCEPFREAQIIVAGANFGSGSSREQAVWALLGRGIRCVIAPSFGEIFAGNCLRNGILPIVLPQALVTQLLAQAEAGAQFTVDLAAQTLMVTGGSAMDFAIKPERRLALLNGWDETDQISNTFGEAIAAFETRQRGEQPWLYEEDKVL